MSNYWGLSLTDDDAMGAQAARNAGWLPPEPAFPETMKALDIDPWESPANVASGISTVSGTPFVNPAGASPAPGVQAAPAFVGEAQARLPEAPMQPAYAAPFTEGVFAPPPDTRTSLQKGLGLLDSIVTAPGRAYYDLIDKKPPTYNDYLKEAPLLPAVQEASGDLFAGLGRFYDEKIMRGQEPFNPLGLPNVAGDSESAGRFIGKSLVPTTYAEIAAAPLLGLTPFDNGLVGAGKGLSTAANAAKTGATSYADNALRAGAGAVPDAAVRGVDVPPALLRTEGTNIPRFVSPTMGEGVVPIAGAAGKAGDDAPLNLDALGITGTPREKIQRINALQKEGALLPRQVADLKEYVLEEAKVGETALRATSRGAVPVDQSDYLRGIAQQNNIQTGAARPDVPERIQSYAQRAQTFAADTGEPRYVYATPSGKEPYGVTNRVPTNANLPEYWRVTPDGEITRFEVPRGLMPDERLQWLKDSNARDNPRGISPTEGEGIMRTAGAAGATGKEKNYATRMIKRAQAMVDEAARDVQAGRISEDHPSIAKAQRELDYATRLRELMNQMPGNQAWEQADANFHPPAPAPTGAVITDAPAGSGGARSVSDVGPRQSYGPASSAVPSPPAAVPEASPAGLTDAASAPPSGGPPSGTAAGGEDPGFAANIRLSKYREEVRAPIKQWAADNPDVVQAARRGIQTDEQVQAAGRQLAEDVGADFSKLQKKWKAGDAWNAEEITAIRGVLNDRTQNVLDAAKAARSGDIEAQAKLMMAIEEQAKVQEIVHGVTAEAGRALRSFRQETVESLANQDIARLRQLLGRAVSDGTLQDVANDLAKLNLDDPAALNKYIRGLQKPEMWDYIHELWINSVLSGPKTHIVNIVSNAMSAAISPIERGLAAAADVPISKIQGRPRARFFSEAPADAFGAVSALPEAWDTMIKVMKGGINPSSATKLESHVQAFKGPLGTAIRAPGTALEMMDSFFYTLNYRAALNANIMRQAKGEGLKGAALVDRVADLKLEPSYKLIKSAREAAEYRVFRQESKLANQLIGLRERSPALKLFLPFVKTPTNVVKFGLERSPLGILDPTATGPIRALIKKDPVAADKFARVALGSIIAGAAAWQFGEGNITGAAPKNAAERDRFYREGRVPFSVKIGGQWVGFQRLEPFNQPLTQLAGAIDALKDNDSSAEQKVMSVVMTMVDNLSSQTFLTGIGDMLNAIAEPDRNAERVLTRTASGFMPFSSLSRTATQLMDTTVRQPEGIVETFKAQIPGLSKDVPARQTAFGQDAQRNSPALSPYQISGASQSDVDRVLEELDMEVGFVGNSIGGQKLTREQQHVYQQVAGQLVYADLVDLIASTAWAAADNTEKQEMLEKTVSGARAEVRKAIGAVLGGGSGP